MKVTLKWTIIHKAASLIIDMKIAQFRKASKSTNSVQLLLVAIFEIEIWYVKIILESESFFLSISTVRWKLLN